jgi:peptidoglycan-associated lipoprotein
VKAPEPVPEVAPAPAPVVEVDPLNDPANILAKRSIYYPLDVSTVQDADKPVVEAHAKYLSEHPDRKVRVEGNADERGSNEYNLALGQRRADGVKKMLELGGAKSSQIETASYGEEKPRCTDHNEACWSQNRRSDIKY